MRQRFNELDIVRGLSVIGMILVIVPGAWDQRFGWLNHAEWKGLNLADTIFPAFLFCVGVSLILSINKRLSNGKQKVISHILIRGSLLIVLGIGIAFIPDFDFHTVRIPGVLQRIGVCYILVGVLVTSLSKSPLKEGKNIQIKALIISAGIIAILYWVILNFIRVPGFNHLTGYDSEKSWPAFIDRHIFGVNHLWSYGQTNGVVTYDPEGLLSTLPACINVIAGATVGFLYKNEFRHFKPPFLILFGCILIFSGWLLDITNIDPLIKKIWTSGFALLSSGISIVAFGLIMVSNKNIITKVFYPAKIFGSNALLGFIIGMLSGLLIDKPLLVIEGKQTSLRSHGFSLLNQSLHSPQYASFLFSIIYLTVAYFILLFLFKKKWFVKL